VRYPICYDEERVKMIRNYSGCFPWTCCVIIFEIKRKCLYSWI